MMVVQLGLGTVERILGVALRHHEGHVLVHAEGAGVVYHHSTMLRDGLGKLLACAASGTGEGDVNALEVVVVLQKLHLNLLASEGVFSSGTALAAEQQKFVDGEVSLVKHAQEFLAYGTAGAYYCYFHRIKL